MINPDIEPQKPRRRRLSPLEIKINACKYLHKLIENNDESLPFFIEGHHCANYTAHNQIKKHNISPERKISDLDKAKIIERLMIEDILSEFKRSPSLQTAEEINELLKAHNKKITYFIKEHRNYNQQIAIRAAFHGSFNFAEDNPATTGYSKEYIGFKATPLEKRPTPKFSKYFNWDDVDFIKALKIFSRTSELIEPIKQAISNQKIPQDVIEKLTIFDVAHILYKEKNPKREPHAGHPLSFEEIDGKRRQSVKQQFVQDILDNPQKRAFLMMFLLDHGVSQEYIETLHKHMEKEHSVYLPLDIAQKNKYTGIVPIITIHHKQHIKDNEYFFAQNPQETNGPENLAICIDFYKLENGIIVAKQINHNEDVDKHKYGFEHSVDINADNICYRLETTSDDKTQTPFILAGLETVYIPKTAKPNEQTNQQPRQRSTGRI